MERRVAGREPGDTGFGRAEGFGVADEAASVVVFVVVVAPVAAVAIRCFCPPWVFPGQFSPPPPAKTQPPPTLPPQFFPQHRTSASQPRNRPPSASTT